MSEQIVRIQDGIGRVITKQASTVERTTPNLIDYEYRLSLLENQAGFTWNIINSNYTASNDERLMANTSAGSFILTLPPYPVLGTHIKIIDYAGTFVTNNLIVDGNSKPIMGTQNQLICNMNHIEFNLYFSDNTQGWKVGN